MFLLFVERKILLTAVRRTNTCTKALQWLSSITQLLQTRVYTTQIVQNHFVTVMINNINARIQNVSKKNWSFSIFKTNYASSINNNIINCFQYFC